jgi:hypothetical protein
MIKPFAKSNNSIETKLVAGPSRHRPTGPQASGVRNRCTPVPLTNFHHRKKKAKWRLRLHAAQEAALLTFCAKISTEAKHLEDLDLFGGNHPQPISRRSHTPKLLEACVDDTDSCELSSGPGPCLYYYNALFLTNMSKQGIYLPIPSLPNNPSSLV